MSQGPHPRSEARVDRLGFECEHTKDALVNTVKRVVAHEAFERLDAEAELANGEAPLVGQTAFAKP